MIFLKLNKIFYFALLSLSLGSCAINSNVMFKTPKDGSFKYDSIPMKPAEDYRIAVDDKIVFMLSTNKGENIIESMSGTYSGAIKTVNTVSSATGQNVSTSFANNWNEYTVMNTGFIEVPMLGDLFVEGLTISQCEDTLEKLFSPQYQSPFVQVRVNNQRCIIFPGNGSDAKIIPIMNNNTTLMEIIALSGGIPTRGRSKIIKVMRKVGDKRDVYLVDLSTIEGLKYADMIIQSKDYIYIEPNPQILRGVLTEATPITSLISTALLLYAVINKFK